MAREVVIRIQRRTRQDMARLGWLVFLLFLLMISKKKKNEEEKRFVSFFNKHCRVVYNLIKTNGNNNYKLSKYYNNS
jgi:hypothetical protein